MPRFRVQMARTEYFDLYYEADTQADAIDMAMHEDQVSIYQLARDNPFAVESDDWQYNHSEELA